MNFTNAQFHFEPRHVLIQPENICDDEKLSLFSQLLSDCSENTVVIDPDLIKYFFEDFREESHRAYSDLCNEFFEYILSKDKKRKIVYFTGGGSGSGKSEIIVNSLVNSNFNGFVLDRTLAVLDYAVQDIDLALKYGNIAKVHGIVTDIEKAFIFNLKRFQKTGRRVPLNIFIDKHLGFIKTFPLLINYYNNNPNVEFTLTDNRKISGLYETNDKDDICDILKPLQYDRKILEMKLVEINNSFE